MRWDAGLCVRGRQLKGCRPLRRGLGEPLDGRAEPRTTSRRLITHSSSDFSASRSERGTHIGFDGHTHSAADEFVRAAYRKGGYAEVDDDLVVWGLVRISWARNSPGGPRRNPAGSKVLITAKVGPYPDEMRFRMVPGAAKSPALPWTPSLVARPPEFPPSVSLVPNGSKGTWTGRRIGRACLAAALLHSNELLN